MAYQDILDSQTEEYNKLVTHPLQSYEWGEFRKKTGIKVIRRGRFENNKLSSAFQITIHKIPHTPFYAGYFPKGNIPDKETINELVEIGKKENCIFIQLEPNVKKLSNFTLSEVRYRLVPDEVEGLNSSRKEGFSSARQLSTYGLRAAVHPLFTRFTFQLDLTQSEEQLLKNMHPKTRYNIKVAQKNGVTVQEDNSDKAFETYIRLAKETTSRQGFYAHSENYHRLMWETLKPKNSKLEYRSTKQIQNTNDKKNKSFEHSNLEHSKIVSDFGFRISDLNQLTAHLLIAKYHKPYAISYTPLVTWILLVFKDTLYYPYGASSREHREIMASNLMMWEAIKFGKKLGLKKFDMWGALSPNPDPKDPWYGFHRFKQGYGPEHIEFVGSYDLVTNPFLYPVYSVADKVRWFLLNLRK